MTESKPGQLYAAGKLSEAIEAALDEVKQHPADTDRRWLLCELLCFVDELERVDKQLETIAIQDPQSLFSVTMFRNLIRAEQARRQFFAEGAMPKLIGELTEHLQLHLDAAAAIREGRLADAAKTLQSAEACRPRSAGVCDDQHFDDFRDADDLTAPFFEALTPMGEYCWLPIHQLQSIEFGDINRMTDVVWREAKVVKTNSSEGQVYLPTMYFGTRDLTEDQLRLGRGTDWREAEGEPTRGIGQRVFLVGHQGQPMLELTSIQFEPTSP